MKISCPSCSAKYSVADEKIQARLAKIRCRKCSATIVIDGTASPATVSVADVSVSEGLAPDGPGGGALQAATTDPQVGADQANALSVEAGAVAGSPVSGGLAAGGLGGEGPATGEFAVDIADNDQRNMSVDQIVTAYNEGVITAETYIWREGMADWETLAEVPEIATALHAAAAASASAPVVVASAAAVSNENSSTDLFGGIDRAGGEDDITTSAPNTEYQATAGTGARNESSVLFSLSALTASDAGPAGTDASLSAARSSDDSGLIDLQALTSADAAPVSAGGMVAGGAPGFGASPLMSAPLGGVSGPVLGGPMGQGYNKRSSARAWILGGVGISAALLIAFAILFKQGDSGAPTVSAETVQVTPTVAEKVAAAAVRESPTAAIEPAAVAVEPAVPLAKETAEPEALSTNDLAVVKAPPRVVKKPRRKAASKPKATRRPKPVAKKAAPVRAKTPAPEPTAKPKKKKRKKKRRKKNRCNCAPSDLMCAMKCSAKKR